MIHGMVLKIQKDSMFKAIIFILGFLVFALFFLIPRNMYSEETGHKYFKNYSYKEYDHQAQNWGMAQAKNGIIYVANQGGVLEFDGVSWRVIDVPNYTVRSIAIDEEGTVYIGGKGEIGYLIPDEKGSLKYESLLNRLDDNQKKFSNVWRTHVTKEGIYFCPSELLLRWDPKHKQMKVWKGDQRFLFSFTIEGRLLIHQEKIGLMQMVNDTLEILLGDKIFADAKERIFMIVPYDNHIDTQMLLIGTRLKGFYLYDGKIVKSFPTEVDDYLKKNIAYHGTRLTSGDFALATSLGGVVIMDSHGRLKCIFDKTSGLQDDNVKYVFQDNQGNMWLCLDKGISKIEYSSPFSIYDSRSDLPGIVLSIVRCHSDLYVGTTRGLYVLAPGSKTFYPVPGVSSSCWSLLYIKDSILAATSQGIFHIKKDFKRKVIKDLSFVLLASQRYPGRTWCGTKSGLVVLSGENDQWIEEHRFETIKQEIRFMAEDKNGRLWLGTSTRGVIKVDVPVNIKHQETDVTRYGTSHGLPASRVYVSTAAGHVLFATEKGIFKFNEKENTFIPDSTLGPGFTGGQESKNVFLIVEDKNKNIWFHSQSRNFQAIPAPGGSFTINSLPFRRIPEIQVNAIYPDPDGKTTWFASFDGLIRYDPTIEKNYKQNFNVLIRRVVVNGNLIFDGCDIKTGTNSKHPITIFNYKERKNFHFEFASTFFEAETETNYRYLMEGHDDNWSDWSSETNKDFTTFDSGGYVFRVQAKNVYGQLGTEATFRFRILPPWYKTWWALLLYGIGFFLLMFLVVKWRSNKLEQEKQKLEYTIKQRTKEIQEKNKQLKDQSDKLKEMDKVKSRFFANISHEFRTPLTLIMGPIEQMLSDNRDKKQKKKIKMMLRNTQRLLTLINQLLDLSRFDSGKMGLKASCENIVPFLKGTVASFHMVAMENQLKMEFHSEEEEVCLYFDARKMEEVMYNLLINAVKFTPPGGKITVSVSKEQYEQRIHSEVVKSYPGFVYISVRDTGPGISQQQLDHIFDRFYQAEGLKEMGHKGTGIGLALTKEIVLLHHGKINVHSQEGKGTEFVIHLPMGREHLKPREIVSTSEAASGKGKNKEIETLYMTTGDEEEADRDTDEIEAVGDIEIEVHENKTHPQEKNVILVVEDESDVREFIRSPLDPFYTVVEAEDGKKGIAKAKEIIPDLIVSDIMMPEVDGYELCRELKRDIKTSHIPVILLTAKASEESIIKGLETGADDYITKPFNTKILMTRIQNLIDLRRQLQLKIQRPKMLLPDEISVSPLDKEFLKEFQDVIEKNFSDPDFCIDMLCKKLYMTRPTLFRKVKALTGETPNQFIMSHRLEQAAQLLRENFGNVTQVAMAVGFSTPQYFASCFKEKFHQSPSEFQASQSQ